MNTAELASAKVTWEDVKSSSGPEAKPGDNLLVLYKVALSVEDLDRGVVIESTFSPDQFVEIVYSKEALLPGVFLGLQGMRAGGSVRRIRIPAAFAFGQRGHDPLIPPGSDLVVDLCLARVLTGIRNTAP